LSAGQSPAQPAKATDPALFGPAAARSRLIISQATGARTRGVVALGAPVADDNAGMDAVLKNGILSRELIRQAMLIAARDELGLATRDEVLGESLPAAPGGPTLELGSFMMSRNGVHLTNHAFVARGEGDRAERLLVVDLPCPYSPDGSLAKLVEKAEALSRAAFPRGLAKLGVTGKASAARASAPVPDGVEDQLSQLGFPGVFAAIRSVHEAIRTDGESPARLGALARGYALLGVLSEFHWHPAHKALKARALLYAQRMVAREPNGARALRHRAFARALIGMHRDALADLAAAVTAEDAGNPASRPDWVDLIEALAHHDARRLASAPGSQAKLAALLGLMAVQYPVGSRRALDAARRVAEVDPGCFRAYEAMCRAGGVANGHTATTAGLEAFARTVPESLKSMPGIPQRVRDFLNRPVGGDLAQYEAFEKSGRPGDDPGEPSWGAMGHLLRETRFVQVYHRLRFMRYDWAVPVDEFWNETRLSVAGHRFYPVLEMIAAPTGDSVRAHAAFFDRLTRLELEPVEISMFRILQGTRNRNAMRAWSIAEQHVDQVAADLAEVIQGTQPDGQVEFGRMLLEVSPHSPFAIATLIEHDRSATASQVAEWEKKAGDSPPILAALARLHTQQKKPELAERELNRYIEQQPEYWAFQMLAANYKARGDVKRWQETLERSLGTEETGLEHVQAQVELADYFMEQGQWANAKEYAEAAGESFAAFGMSCAQRCAEGMKDWPRAEQWAQRQSERYPEQADTLFRWYLFCMKTGRGNLRAARQYTEQLLQERGGLESLHPDFRANYAWLNGDLKAACGLFRESYRRSPNFGSCLSVMATADRLGDRATVDEYQKLLFVKHRKEAPEIVRIVELLLDVLNAGKPRTPDLKAVNQALETMPPQARPASEIWIGLFLKGRGQAAAARPFFEHCVASRVIPEWHRALAGKELRDGRR
jgi:tetratricopeptide (TPR) repeat protein